MGSMFFGLEFSTAMQPYHDQCTTAKSNPDFSIDISIMKHVKKNFSYHFVCRLI